MLGVADAGRAAIAVSVSSGPCILVIDAGLLHMEHDGQWRRLVARHPALGLVVRCLGKELRWTQEGAAMVHPDHEESLVEAVRTVGAARERG